MRKYIPLLCAALLGFIHTAGAQKAPTDTEAKALALDSLVAFNKAIATKDFTSFHKQISTLWQAQVTPEKLKTIFQTFIDQQMDLSAISGVQPVFNPAPTVDGDGVLVLQGSYPTTPLRVDFRLKYVNEKSAWKLIGIKVEAKPAGIAGKLPTNEEAQVLVRDSLVAFNAAVQTKSFVDFHKGVAVMWQKQVTPERLAELFAPFIKAEANLSGITRLEPTFSTAPAINENGILELKGSYPTRPSKVIFDLAYLFEGTEWKLVKINVNVQPAGEAAKTGSSPAAKKAADDDDEE
jgi:hypothetical protein